MTPGRKEKAGRCQVSFPRPWCRLPVSAVLRPPGKPSSLQQSSSSGKSSKTSAEPSGMEDCRGLGEDNPWTRAAPRVCPVRSAAVPHLPCCSPQPTAWSCILVPCPREESPKGSSPHPSPRTQREGGLWAAAGAGRRDCSGQLGRLCDMPIPLCSLQLQRDRRRTEQYLNQSLPYLEDAQATLRTTAVRFIGEPQPPGSRFWQPSPSPAAAPAARSSPVAARASAAPCRALASLSHP